MSTISPPKTPPPKPPQRQVSPAAAPTENKTFRISSGKQIRPLKVCVYGTGGIGKSELAANISQLGLKVLFVDADNGSAELDVHRVEGIDNFHDLRGLCHSDLPNQFDVVVFDTLTKIQEWSEAWTIANIKHEKGHAVDSLEGYGFGKGIVHAYETFLTFIGDMDALVRRGKHVITVAHECTSNVPNPAGDDWIRFEPRLQSPASGKSSIRHRVKEWVDHLLYVGYDVMTKGGKGTGSGTRAIYCQELPTFWAKSRSLSETVVYKRGSSDLWQKLLERSE